MNMKEGHNIGWPQLLEGPNHGYWKARMKDFLKATGDKAWLAVEHG
jgi:hypothetical protein